MSPQGLASSDTGAGVNPWWTYVKREIPGVGSTMLNVGTGNLVVQATDVDVPGRELNLDFERTYNSQSRHDAGGDDGSEPAIFGNGWTNTYDAHMVVRSSGQNVTAISVYDGAGTRCDYTPDTQNPGQWDPCPGEHAILEVDPNSQGCSYWWIQKDGTAMWFHSPFQSCINQPATEGHLYAIYGRNSNNNITLSYSFVPNQPQTAENITEIDANHSDGQSLKMGFALADNTGPNELVTLTRPDASFLVYDYDINGDLTEVDRPAGNGSSLVPETYSASHPMQFACSPRASLSSLTDGACLTFSYNSNVTLMDWNLEGTLNPDPGDGFGPIQPAPARTGWHNDWYTANFVYGSGSGCSGSSAGTTTFCDSDGHSTIWTINTASAVTQTQAFTGPSSSLITKETWDASNDLVATIDPQGNETDYAYDGMGNTIAVGLPSVSDMIVNGSPATFRPTFLFSYDAATNNLLSACDPVYTNTLGLNWTTTPSGDSLCPTTTGSATSPTATVYQYQTETAEPYGLLKNTYTPMGYQTNLSYNHSAQGGDFGLPTQSAAAQPISENDGGSAITPVKNYTYDPYGNVLTFGNGQGTWTITYDALNRPTVINDPTNVNSYSCYNPDNSISGTSTAHQYQLDGRACGSSSPSYTYDADGDSVSDWRGYTAGQTTRTYDGLDRLVEVQVPADANIDAGTPGIWRYFYDITGQGASANLSIGSKNNIVAYGGLFKTQQCLGNWPCALHDVNGNAFDPLNRTTARYQYAPTYPGTPSPSPSPGAAPGPLQAWTYTYDGVHSQGLLTSSQDPIGISTTYNYDSVNRVYLKSFSDSTPAIGIKYDPDSRTAQLNSTVGIETYTYSADGWQQSYAESGGIRDPETLTYAAYANGWRKSVQVQDAGANFNETFKYAYRVDGARRTLNLGTNTFTWTYDNTGRETSQTDPYAQQTPLPNIPSANWPGTSSPEYTNGITIGAQSMNYDSTGLLSSMTMASGAQYTNILHNAAGSVTRFGINIQDFVWVPNGGYQTNPFVNGVQYGYDVRREYNQLQATAPSVGQYTLVQEAQVLFGHPVTCYVTNLINCSQPSGVSVDGKTGGVYQLPWPAPNGCSGANQNVSYDGDGRQYSMINVFYGTLGCPPPILTDLRTYDAENHTTTISSANDTFTWGPSGHMATATNSPFPGQSTTYTMHWDGADLLFVTDGSDRVDQVNIEHLATKNGKTAALVVYDRDFSGAVVDSHTGTADSGISVMQDYYSPYTPLSKFGIATVLGSYPSAGSMPTPPVMGMQRDDGYEIGGLTFSGVRTYDSTTQQWTTPDDYKGRANDPMSQMAYQWNSNNPLDNTDPSGFTDWYPQPATVDCPGGLFGACGPFTALDIPGNSPVDAGKTIAIDPIILNRHTPLGCVPDASNPSAPPWSSYDQVYLTGLANGADPFAFYAASGAYNGPFNWQHQGPIGEYRAAGNFALGVYAAAANIPEGLVDQAIQWLGAAHGLSVWDIIKDMDNASKGRAWASHACHF